MLFRLLSRPAPICFHITCATTCTAYLKHSQSSTPAARYHLLIAFSPDYLVCMDIAVLHQMLIQPVSPCADSGRWLGHLKKRAVCCFATRRPSSCGSVSTCWASHQYTSCNTLPCCCCWSCSIASQQKELGSLMKKLGSLIIIKKNVERSLKNKPQS